MKRRAFTLVELLVVIAIIGLLTAMAVVSVGGARRKARNAKRIADNEQLLTAFNLGLSANGSLPSSGGDVWACVTSSCGGGWSGYGANATVDAFLAAYISPKIIDPSDGNSRGYSGYLYNGAWVGGTSPLGVTLPAGSYLNYLLEPQAACGPGVLWNSQSTFVQCYVKIE